MEVFHTSKLLGAADVGAWGWSKSHQLQPLLAVATSGAAVNIYTAQGVPWRPVKGAIRNIRGTPAACLAWHPQLPLLAVAWKDGAVSVWDAARRHLEEDSKVHRQAVSHILWHDGGGHLLTADVQGKVALWQLNRQHQPVCKSTASEGGCSITHIAWDSRNLPSAAAFYATSSPGSSNLSLTWLEEGGLTGVVQDIGEQLQALLHCSCRNQLIAVTASGSAVFLESSSSPSKAGAAGGEWTVALKMKFAGATDGAKLQVCWAGPDTLATASASDGSVRLLQLDTQDNFALDLRQAQFSRADSGREVLSAAAGPDGPQGGVAALACAPAGDTLAAATTDGWVCLFKRATKRPPSQAAADPAKQCQPQQSFQVGPGPCRLGWGAAGQVLGAQCEDGLYICVRSLLQHKLSDGYAVIQASPSRVLIEQLSGPPKPVARLSTALKLAGLDVTSGTLLLHDGRAAELHRISSADNSTSLLAQFEGPGLPEAAGDDDKAARVAASPAAAACAMALHGDSLYRVAERRVEVCSLSGVVKQTLAFEESQGQPLLLHTHDGFLAVLTSKAVVRVFKLAGREAKPHAGPGLLLADGAARLTADAIRINCSGSMVVAWGSSAGQAASGHDSRLCAYSSDLNGPLAFDFAADNRAPRAVTWDLRDPRLLAVQMMPLMQATTSSSDDDDAGGSSSSPDAAAMAPQLGGLQGAAAAASGPAAGPSGGWLEVAVMFASAEAGLLLQEYQDLSHVGASGFLGLAAPHLLLHKKTIVADPGAPPHSSHITRVPLQGFSGIVDADEATRAALLDFNYLLAVGRLDEAFRAVAAVKSPAVWRSMAHMAIKNKRLDVAEHCLGNMEHVHGARALRESGGVAELDARVGLVAVQLGLADDAARLFASCGRWDLLEQLHQASGNWAEALQVARQQDRIHLQSVHHAYARHLEAIGAYSDALKHYVESGTAAEEVPRMLCQQGDLAGLERHVMQSGEPSLLSWWARYCESTGHFPEALSCYQRAGNQLAALRIHCATGNWQAAEELVTASQDPAAAFHLARLYEAQDKVADALRCYNISKRYSHGARLAKRCDMDQELLSLALKSPPPVMLEAADHLLAAGNAEAAALLYRKGGKLGKAVEMAFSNGLFEVLDSIAEQLDQEGNPALIARCAEAFLSAGQHDKAVRLLVRGGQQQRALDLLVAQEVALTDELAEALTPDKTPDNADSRAAVLMRIAQAAKHQGLYHLACKKFTQAGDRLKAVKALVKSGDTEKIVFFAGVSRQREVYVIAANFLQTLDWRSNPELLKHILGFYTKAGAADSLASFYLSCAEREIDGYRDYAKASQALQEAAKHVARSRASDRETQLQALEARLGRIGRFVSAQDVLGSDPAAAVTICQQLLQELPPQQEAGPDVRAGDVLGMLVQWCCQQGNMPQALQLLAQMRDRGLQLQHYLGDALLAEIYLANGMSGPAQDQRQPLVSGAGGDMDEVQEELPSIDDDDFDAGR